MRFLLPLLLACLLLGCAKTQPEMDAGKTAPEITGMKASKKKISAENAPVLTPSLEKFGRVAMVNPSARFVVLSFPIGDVADAEQVLNVYRDGLKVGEVRVTGPQRENNTVADIVVGDPRVNDEVRGN